MTLENQIEFRNNPKYLEYLKQNSNYIKFLDRDVIDYKRFVEEMKIKYQERATDKISKAIDNIDVLNNIIDIFN
jgi:hypothetical protein